MAVMLSFWLTVLDAKNSLFAVPTQCEAVANFGIVIDVTNLKDTFAPR